MSILQAILRDKKREVAASKERLSPAMMKQAALALPKKNHAFLKALRSGRAIAVIAEIKRKSPSKGLLSRDFDPARIAEQYEKAGAAAVSVLTDNKYFGGSLSFLQKVKKAAKLPVLRKDFIVDEYQVYESRVSGADAVLLIAGVLKSEEMRSFYRIADRLGMDVLFEAHDRAELKKVLTLKPSIVGINNRDLKTFHVDLNTCVWLSSGVPKNVLWVAESGVRDEQDLRFLKAAGASAVLVGESLMREKDPGKALQRLLGGTRGSR